MAESKQDVVVRLVKEGMHSRVAIKEEAGCTSGALASYFSGMRNAAKYTGEPLCPVEIELEDGSKVMVAKTIEEVESIKEERAATRTTAAAKKSPEERYEAAVSRLSRCESALDKLDDRISSADGEVAEEVTLRFEKAKIEVRLAEIELDRCKGLVDSSEDVEEDEDTESSEEDLM